IEAIDKKSVHQICSGQVIVDLPTAVKELVENSLDAGATNVEIRLKSFGLLSIEVIDDGHGVEERNFHGLTMKHHTSKLTNFTDLRLVETFGFRGEALSSLCAVCDVIICTKHNNASSGHRMSFNHEGHMTSKTPCARRIGTSVILRNIFSTIPVRRKEFMKNIKKEYSKLLNLVSAYCVVSTRVKITCSNETDGGKKTTSLSTGGATTMEENIISIFGSKQFRNLQEFRQDIPTQESCDTYNVSVASDWSIFKLHGFVSVPRHGAGRSSPDRQFFFVNSRPITLPRLSKIVNEVYHRFNRHQFPFIAINITTRHDLVDVNVTPDKRKVFFQNENLLFAIMTSSMTQLYSLDGCHEVGSTECSISLPCRSPSVTETSQTFSPLSSFRRTMGDDVINSDITKPRKRSASFATKVAKQPRLDKFVMTQHKVTSQCWPVLPDQNNERSVLPDQSNGQQVLPDQNNERPVLPDQSNGQPVLPDQNNGRPVLPDQNQSNGQPVLPDQNNGRPVLPDKSNGQPVLPDQNNGRPVLPDHNNGQPVLPDQNNGQPVLPDAKHPSNIGDSHVVDTPRLSQTSETSLKFSFKHLMEFYKEKKKPSQPPTEYSLFRANLADTTTAEAELTKNLDKSSFQQMAPVGQFNLGFVIGRHGNDLFIIDQHASDEIYNYETLQATQTLQTQNLVVPLKLQLTPAGKIVLIENLEIFRKNGFGFKISSDEVTPTPTATIHLTTIPTHNPHPLGPPDIDEMIFMLSDAPGVMCRPTRVRRIFATRACRMSTMIGTSLTKRQMLRLIRHMSEIVHPWNCPHGRPTMRHLIDIGKLRQ
uniref:Mismatch repair endonuclease PMS2-like n=1 Tax=Ciona intestinalis TaxID=7719 RepID=F6XQD4_CIOIN